MQHLMPSGLSHTRQKSSLALILCSVLAGCGGGGGDTTATTDSTVNATAQTVSLRGSVGDGPIVGATVTIKDAKGKILSSSVSDANANYSISIKAPGNAYPVTLEATGGTDIVTNASPDFMLLSAALSPSAKRANLNPYSTLIVETAKRMPGGLTSNNVGLANQAILNQLNFGLYTFSMPDPISTPVSGSNVAMIVKASETFGEMIRRTRDTLMLQGTNVSGDDVMNALASDLIDGVVDGIGGSQADPRVAAVSSLTGAQVLIEAMSNTLKVYGVDATHAMDAAIRQIMPDAPADAVTANVRVTAQSLTQARTSIKAAQALAPSTALTTISKMLETIQPGASAEEVAKIMPADTSTDLNSVIFSAAVATTQELATVNTIVGMQYGSTGTTDTQTTTTTTSTDTTSTDTTSTNTTSTNTTSTNTTSTNTTSTNTAPTIKGSPATITTAGISYRLAPTAQLHNRQQAGLGELRYGYRCADRQPGCKQCRQLLQYHDQRQ
jgi:hypothetical protein